MHQRHHRHRKFPLHAYGLFCALLVGCSSPGGNYDLGQADAQIGGLISDYPALQKQLEEIRVNIRQAENALREKEATIDNLAKAVTRAQDKADSRLTLIWKLTSGLLGILLAVGAYIAWKLK